MLALKKKWRLLSTIATGFVCTILLFACDDDEQDPVDLGIGRMEFFDTYRTADVGWTSSDGAVLSGTLSFPRASGLYPAVMFHFGSNKWSRRSIGISIIRKWVNAGFVVLVYDKRGVDLSQGECCPWQDPDYFPLLGHDVLTGIQAIAVHPEIRNDAMGVYGFSQGGWVLPVSAAESTGEIAFVVIGSGPTVTLGEELLYSQLTGENQCEETGISLEEIADQLELAGPSMFDPWPYLERMPCPALWVYGENDLSVPVVQCINILDSLIEHQRKPFEYWLIEDANHSWIVDGGICQTSGVAADTFPEIFDWVFNIIN